MFLKGLFNYNVGQSPEDCCTVDDEGCSTGVCNTHHQYAGLHTKLHKQHPQCTYYKHSQHHLICLLLHHTCAIDNIMGSEVESQGDEMSRGVPAKICNNT